MHTFVETRPDVFQLRTSTKDRRGNWSYAVHDQGVSRIRPRVWVAFDAASETSDQFEWASGAVGALKLRGENLGFRLIRDNGAVVASGC